MTTNPNYLKSLPQDAAAGVVVFLVALPLCLGVALASGAPLISGITAGVVGGVLVAWLSGSHTSISGPAAGLTAIVAAQITALGSFDAFLVAVVLAGVLQLVAGGLRAGSLAAFFPTSVIKGLLSAIGIILILKQIPHLFGHDDDWLGDMSFRQLDGDDSFSELAQTLFDIHVGPSLIGFSALALLIFWDRTPLKKTMVPAPLAVVVMGVAMGLGLDGVGGGWAVGADHLVQVPVSDSLAGFFGELHTPDFAAITNPTIAVAAITIAVVASLETLLNLEAVDKLDPQKRASPPNRELIAQGVGNMTAGMLGGLPITSVVVRSSVGISAGGQTRITCFVHGTLLLVLVVLLPGMLNLIPLSCLAAVLMVTGFKLATPAIFREMYAQGRSQFLPFLATIVAIVLTDLLVGILIGLAIASVFILYANLQRPLRKVTEQRDGGEVLRIELASQVTFLSRAVLVENLREIPDGSQVVLDARRTAYLDKDIEAVLHEFEDEIAPAHDITVARLGFDDPYPTDDQVKYAEVSTEERQEGTSPEQVLGLLKDGNERFVRGAPLARDRMGEIEITAQGQYPLAAVLACMDSRVATETIFDCGVGDLFSIRVAGNIVSEQGLGSMEYGCAVAGVKLLVVLGHTRCGAVGATVDAEAGIGGHGPACDNLGAIVAPIAEVVRTETQTTSDRTAKNTDFMQRVTVLNVHQSMAEICERSGTLRGLIDEGKLVLVGAVYDVSTGKVEFLDPA